MPSKERVVSSYRALLEAALDQRAPSPELAAAVQRLLRETEHSARAI